jgi:hypothetical protein
MHAIAPHTLELEIHTKDYLFQCQKPKIRVGPGLTMFVGPNGAGKSQVLRRLKDLLVPHLLGKKVRYLSAGRASPFERFRSSVETPHGLDHNPAYVGHTAYREQWFGYESLTGDFLALERRADLRLKVQARLQAFLSRSIRLIWGQNGLEIRIVPITGGDAYSANEEASGVLQLVPLLAAIYNDEVGALLIDEPEISLHPQYQAYLMQELHAVAGDPAEPGKKFVIVATHSPSSLWLRSAAELSRMVFFNDQHTLPIQISEDAGELKNRKLKALVARLTATHRLAFFARNVLLVEGPSDEIIVAQLARVLNHPILPANTQIVPVTGKSEFTEALRLFELMGKRAFVLADVDAVVDANTLVNSFSIKPGASEIAQATGHKSLVDLDKGIRSDLAEAVSTHWTVVESLVSTHHYWTECPANERSEQTRRRVVLAVLMTTDGTKLDQLAGSTTFTALRRRFSVLFDALEKVGCFILRRGTIEDYYGSAYGSETKPEAAALEAASFDDVPVTDLNTRYADIVRALKAAAPLRPIDENALLRERLGGALGATFQFMETGMSAAELNGRARAAQPDFEIFELENCSTSSERRVRVKMNSPLFRRGTLPFDISISDNQASVILSKLPRPDDV